MVCAGGGAKLYWFVQDDEDGSESDAPPSDGEGEPETRNKDEGTGKNVTLQMVKQWTKKLEKVEILVFSKSGRG